MSDKYTTISNNNENLGVVQNEKQINYLMIPVEVNGTTIFIPIASKETIGGVRIGRGLLIDSSGYVYVALKDGLIFDEDGNISLNMDALKDYVTKDFTIAGIDLQENITREELLNALKIDTKGQSDWLETDIDSNSYIRNKPTKLSDFENDTNFITNEDINLDSYNFATEDFVNEKIGDIDSILDELNGEVV